MGVDNNVTGILMKLLTTAELKHSRQQEMAADQIGLELIHMKYFHVGGATDFFERLSDKENLPHFLAFFSTHPHHDDRLKSIDQRIKEKHYQIYESVAFDFIEPIETEE